MGKSPQFKEMLVKYLGIKFQDISNLLSNRGTYTNMDKFIYLSIICESRAKYGNNVNSY